MCFIEGCMFRARGVVWIVKGLTHPIGYLTCLPRYTLLEMNEEEVIRKLRVKDVSDLHRIAFNPWFNNVMRFNPCAGRATPLISLKEVEKFYDPHKPIVCETMPRSPPCLVLDYLSSKLEECTVGLTGSSYFSWNEAGDIDVLIFAERENLDQVFYKLRGCSEPLSWSESLDLLSERDYPKFNLEMLKKTRESVGTRKILGFRVFSRVLVNKLDVYVQCDYLTIKEGEIKFVGEVIDDKDSAVFPYKYVIEVLDSDILKKGKVIEVVSERGRFSELASKGQWVNVKGDREIRIHNNGKKLEQVYLWSKHHYIVPISSNYV